MKSRMSLQEMVDEIWKEKYPEGGIDDRWKGGYNKALEEVLILIEDTTGLKPSKGTP